MGGRLLPKRGRGARNALRYGARDPGSADTLLVTDDLYEFEAWIENRAEEHGE